MISGCLIGSETGHTPGSGWITDSTPRGAQWYANISEQPVGTGVRYIGVKPLRGVAIQCPSIQSTIPSTGSTALRKLVLSRSRWTIPKPSAQCSKMPMITSGSPKEPENEQQDAGQSQSSCSIRGSCGRVGRKALLQQARRAP